MSFVKELQWRGMLKDIMPGTEEQLQKEVTTGYIGFDPTADSLHIGSLVPVMLLVHFQRAGHKPIALVGGATAMIGDPSGKSEERNLMTEEEIKENEAKIRKQLEKFLDFDCGENAAELVNNNDWFSKMNFITFLRDIGKHLTVGYLLSKGYIKERIEQELSFTEFNYILMQSYDFFWLYEHANCKLQMGGSDQWGNITAGAELIRKKLRGKAFALTCPLMTKADGSKFGKTEEGNVWLDAKRTSPYKFYQYWMNCSDEDAAKYIRIFTLLNKEEVEQLERQHAEAPHTRALQNALAKDITIRVHSKEDYHAAVDASQILFGKSTADDLKRISEENLLEVFEGVPQAEIAKQEIEQGVEIIELLVAKTSFLPSNSEAQRALKENSISVNKTKVDGSYSITSKDLINDRYVLLQRGKKNYFLVKAV